MFDILIKNAEIIDGSGKGSYIGDIGVKDGRIHKIASIIDKESTKVIDAKGLTVTPGFIDIHSHTDWTVLVNPRAESKVRQGVTTEVVGNCGFTAAPVREEHFEDLMQYLVNTVFLSEEEKKKWKWETQSDYINEIRTKGTSVNIASLVGHGTIRVGVMGFKQDPPTKTELKKMADILKTELEKGLFGMSTGLQYDPSSFSTTEELVELSKVLAEYDAVYATHMKSEGDLLLECVLQAAEIGRKSGVSVEISHLKAGSKKYWGKVDEVLKLIDDSREKGINIDFDVYPYTAFGSGLIDLIPPWARENGVNKMIDYFNDKNYLEKIINDMKKGVEGWENPMDGNMWEAVRIASLKTDKNLKHDGKDMRQISEEMGCDPYEAVIRLLKEEHGSVKMVFFGMKEEDVVIIMKHPRAMFCSDGRAVADYGELSKGKIHPRYYGTFPRILGHYSRDKKLFPLEEAVKKMTLLPALKMNIKDRGLLEEGYFADIVIFDKDKIIDIATFEDPHRYPNGIEYVIVNGEIVVSKKHHTGALPGKVLERGKS